jgi:hypothetical protein
MGGARPSKKSPAWRLVLLQGPGTDAPVALTTGNYPFFLSADVADESFSQSFSDGVERVPMA